MSADFLSQLDALIEDDAPTTGNVRFQPTTQGTGAQTWYLLPPTSSGKLLEKCYVHYTGSEVLTCRAERKGPWAITGMCPLCDEAAVIYKARKRHEAGSSEYQRLTDLVKPYKATERYFINVWSAEYGNRVASFGKTVKDILVLGIRGDAKIGEKGYGDVTEAGKERPFKLVKDMSDGFAKYHKSRFLDVAPIPTAQVADILAGRFDLSEDVLPSSVDEVNAIFAKLKGGAGSVAANGNGNGNGNGSTAVDQSEFERLLGVM